MLSNKDKTASSSKSYFSQIFYPSPQPQQKEKITIICLGSTGVGKSSFVKFLTKFVQPDSLRFDSYNDSDIVSSASAKSVTQKSKKCTLENSTHIFYIQDTPGFGDTGDEKENGLEKDIRHSLNIMDTLFEDRPEKIHAIFLVVNGTNYRLNEQTKLILNQLLVNFEKNHNFVLIGTHVTNSAKHIDVSSLEQDLGIKFVEKVFFNNVIDDLSSLRDDIGSVSRMYTQHFYTTMFQKCSDLFAKIATMQPVSLTKLKEKYDLRLKFLSTAIEIVKDLQNAAHIIDALEKDCKDVEQIVKRETRYYNTLCLYHWNKYVCHEKCGLNNVLTIINYNDSFKVECVQPGESPLTKIEIENLSTEEKNQISKIVTNEQNEQFSHCNAFNSEGICNYCKCKPRDHFSANFLFEVKMISMVEVTLQSKAKDNNDLYHITMVQLEENFERLNVLLKDYTESLDSKNLIQFAEIFKNLQYIMDVIGGLKCYKIRNTGIYGQINKFRSFLKDNFGDIVGSKIHIEANKTFTSNVSDWHINYLNSWTNYYKKWDQDFSNKWDYYNYLN